MPEPWTGKVEWKRTLNTKKPAEAKVRVARALSDCTADFQAAERAKRGEPPITPTTTRFDAALLSELEAGAVRSVLADDEAERSAGDDRRHLQTPEDREQFPLLEPVAFDRKGMMDDHFEALGDNIREDAERYRKALGRNNPSIVSSELRQALRPCDLLGKLTPTKSTRPA